MTKQTDPHKIQVLENEIFETSNSGRSDAHQVNGDFSEVDFKGSKWIYFIVIGLNQSIAMASGCSIDASVQYIQSLEKEYKVSLLSHSIN